MTTRKMNKPIPRPNTTFKENPSRQSLDESGWVMPAELDEYAPLTKEIQTIAPDAAKITGATIVPEIDQRQIRPEKKEPLWQPDKPIQELMKERRTAKPQLQADVKEEIHVDDLLQTLAADVEPEKKGYKGKKVYVEPEPQLLRISQLLLDSVPGDYSDVEMEVKFGTRGIKPITKLDYDNVVKKLYSLNFRSSASDGTYSLKIQSEFLDMRTGEFKSSPDFDRFRVEINTLPLIEEYCRNSNIGALLDRNSKDKVSIMRKQDVKIKDEHISSADFNDFNFRVTYKTEDSINKHSKIGVDLISNWEKTKKQFRYINRVSFTHPDFPFRIDLSVVKSSTMDKFRQLIKTYNIADSNVFQNPETYEIEIEALNIAIKQKYRTAAELVVAVKNLTKTVLSALQRTNYPVSYVEQRTVLTDYMRLLHEAEAKRKGEEYEPKARVYSNSFIGPSSTTLQLKHITPVNPDMSIPNVTAPFAYCVTDKADGDRHLMYINGEGRIYLINSNMDVVFTGSKTEEPRCFDTLIDGELILHNKESVFINTFAAFDIYFVENVNVRDRPFTPVPTKDDRIFKDGCRLLLLKNVIKILDPISVVNPKFAAKETGKKGFANLISQYKVKNKVKSPMTFICKNFYPRFDPNVEQDVTVDKYNIFEGCKFILQRMKDGLYNYNTDGLIFTPTLFGVGGSKIKETCPLKKFTWEYSFKWKPAEFNTIDFLVTTKKGTDNTDIITPMFESGFNMQKATQLSQFKTLELRVGFDELKHGYINPCQDLLDDRVPASKNSEGYNEGTTEDSYKPKKFSPSDPPDVNAGTCQIMLEQDDYGNPQMFTEERHVFTENTIVEFKYDLSRDGLWRWVPLRVRNDKTAEFRNGKISCNDYKTANDNWYSIHNPITEKMIATGEGIPSVTVSDDIYYNRVTSEKRSTGLRDFHNLYVKKILIQAVSKRNGTLIDYACGQGGDFPKWIASNLGFVMGIDISKDNIENRVRGACSRYLSFRKDYDTMPHALFVWGNSSLNIRTGKAAFTDKGSAIIQSVFGQKPIDKHLGPAVARQYAKCADGFDVSSCQFALHYMFENRQIFYNFMRNIAECTKQGGYFIGTSYDGKTVFNRLKNKDAGESIEIYDNETKIWSLTKDYTDTTFDNDESSLGKKILVYQESINQTLPEYLVNYDFFTETMAKYGFQLMPTEEARKRRLPDGTGTFIQLFNKMMADLKNSPILEKDLKEAPSIRGFEKDISFLNRYCVYQKVSTLDVEKLTNVILGQLPEEVEYEALKTKETEKAVDELNEAFAQNPKPKPKAVKLKKTLLLEEATEALEERTVAAKKPTNKSATRKITESVESGEIVEESAAAAASMPAPVPVLASVKEKTKTKKKKMVVFDIVE